MKIVIALLLGLMISSLPAWANERESNTASDTFHAVFRRWTFVRQRSS